MAWLGTARSDESKGIQRQLCMESDSWSAHKLAHEKGQPLDYVKGVSCFAVQLPIDNFVLTCHTLHAPLCSELLSNINVNHILHV